MHSLLLVIGTDRIPDERKRWLLPVSLTTMRIGSFVAVADPGALSNIQDSIRVQAGLFVVQPFRGVAVDRQWNRRVPIIGHSYPGFSLRGHRTQACAPGSNP